MRQSSMTTHPSARALEDVSLASGLRGEVLHAWGRVLASIEQQEHPDVVLLDVMMPGLDGMATLKALKASTPETQVIMLSARNQASTIVEAVRLGPPTMS